jgi:hypothetical protein
MNTMPADDQQNPDDATAQAAGPDAPAPKAKRVRQAVPEVKPAPDRNKPFSMSYGGVTNKEHIDIMIARGAR